MKNEARRGLDNKDCDSDHGLYKCHEIEDEDHFTLQYASSFELRIETPKSYESKSLVSIFSFGP